MSSLLCRMMRKALRTILFLILCVCSKIHSDTDTRSEKKILILSSHGGYGHTAASLSLQNTLKGHYTFAITHPIDELRIWGIPSGEGIYNRMLKFGWYRIVNFASKYLAPIVLQKRYKKLETIVATHIENEKPDLVISLIPFINFPATEAARKKNIPYLLITTDNDLNNWIHDLEKITHPAFEITIGMELPTTKGLLLNKNVASHKIHTIGLPLRTSFFEEKNFADIRNEFELSDKPTVLIMMGGSGCNLAYQYAKTLAKEDLSIQIVVVAGRNFELLERIKSIIPHPSNSIHPIGFTDKIADLMAVSDLLITKPGPGTIAEAIQMKLPVLVDNSSSSLYWEEANRKLVTFYHIGETVKRKDELCTKVEKYIHESRVKDDARRAFEQIPQNTFQNDIENIILAICN